MEEHALIIEVVRNGVAVVELLRRYGCDITITDMNTIRELEELQTLSIRVLEKRHSKELKRENYTLAVKNPGIKYTVPLACCLAEHKVKTPTEVEIDYRYTAKPKYGAMTGVNGKTAVTTMLYGVLKYNHKAIVAGNIGRPLGKPALVYENEKKDVALELNNFQLLGIERFAPHVSMICDLAPNHLNYMPSAESYYENKIRTCENCAEDGWFLHNADDVAVAQYTQHIPCKMIDFSLTRQDVDSYRKGGTVYLHELALSEKENFHVVGDYNLSGIVTASCTAYELGVSVFGIQRAITAFSPVEHHLRYIGEKNGVKLYNDFGAANTYAVIAALNSFNKNIILLANGCDKGTSSEDLKQYDERIKLCAVFGETGPQFQNIFSYARVVETMQEALDATAVNNKEQDTALLSPTYSSYDQFPDYRVRGALFREMVREWLQT